MVAAYPSNRHRYVLMMHTLKVLSMTVPITLMLVTRKMPVLLVYVDVLHCEMLKFCEDVIGVVLRTIDPNKFWVYRLAPVKPGANSHPMREKKWVEQSFWGITVFPLVVSSEGVQDQG